MNRTDRCTACAPRRALAIAAAALVLGLAGTGAARASLLAYEGFDYSTPTLGNGDGGTGWSTPWYGFEAIDGSPGGASTLGIATPSLPVPGGTFAPSGGFAFDPTSLGGGPFARRRLATPIDMAADATYYLSFLLRRDTDPTATLNNLDAYLSLFAGSSSSPLGEAFRMGGGFIGAPDNMGLIGATGVPGPTSSAVAGDFTNGVTYLLVARIDASAAGLDRARLAVYPGLDDMAPLLEPTTWLIGPGPGAEAASPAWDGGQSIDRIRIAGQTAFSIDEIRIGTTWADVTGPVPSLGPGPGGGPVPMPEPGTLALLGTAAAGLGLRRRARAARLSSAPRPRRR